MYTNRLKLSKPPAGQCQWDVDWYRNEDICDAILAQQLDSNHIKSGGLLSGGSGLSIQLESSLALIDDVEYYDVGGSIVLIAAPVGEVVMNWIHYNSTGQVVNTLDPPTSMYAQLGAVDVDEIGYVDHSDLRQKPSFSDKKLLNYLLNPTVTRINQRFFDGLWSAIAVGDYGYDRWRRGTQQDTIEQPVEHHDLINGLYTLSWDAPEDGSVRQNGVTIASGPSPLTMEIDKAYDAVCIVPDTSVDVAFVIGANPGDNAELRSYIEEREMCMAYYHRTGYSFLGGRVATAVYTPISFTKEMRASPSIVVDTFSDVDNSGSTIVSFNSRAYGIISVTFNTPVSQDDRFHFVGFFDAEIHDG